MKRLIKTFKNYWAFWSTIIIGALIAILLTAKPNFSSLANLITFAWIAIICCWKIIDIVGQLRHANFGVDLLAIIAIIACLTIHENLAAYIIVLMLCSGEALESLASNRAKHNLTALIKRQPQIAHRLSNGAVTDIPLTKVQINDTILVKPNEVVPVDGQLISGKAIIDESSLTGESAPVHKNVQDKIISGTLCLNQAVNIRATSTARDSYYSQIIRLVKDIENQPAHFVNLANRYAAPFTILSLIIAGIAWFLSKDATRFAEVLVVASPCPLILAAPIAFVSGMSRCASRGIIVKNGSALERIANADTFAFDKTGTLTNNHLAVSHIDAAAGYNPDTIIAIAAAAESVSTHVLAGSLINYAKEHHIQLAPAKSIRETTGGGVFATVDQRRIVVGNPEFLASNKITGLPSQLPNSTAIIVAVNGKYAGAIYFNDTARYGAKSTIQKLRELGVKHIIMLTGDRQSTARQIGTQIGIKKIYAELKPTDKLAIVKSYQDRQHCVAMVGDGINDTPVLAKADVGVAIGAMGSTVASESADAVIANSRINSIAILRQISLSTTRIARQSVIAGIIICLVLEAIAAFGVIPAVVGALLQEVVDATTIISALRARR